MERKDPDNSVAEAAPASGRLPGATDSQSNTAGTLRSIPCPEDGISAFLKVRPRLFGVAYRMLGSSAEAEDIVQDVWLRWHRTDRTSVRDPAAFLVTTTVRLAINHAKSATARREAYVGTWLPEPVDTSADPALGAERGEALELAVLLLLEKLSPKERAAYVLREAFSYEYDQIAEVLRTSEVNCRQLATRARKHIAEGRRVPVEPTEQRRLLAAFISAAQMGDVAALEGLLAPDVTYSSDGGGLVSAARKTIVGRTSVASFVGPFAPYWAGMTVTWLQTNGQASVLLSVGDTIARLVAIAASEEGIDQLFYLMRPSKLASIARRNALLMPRETA